MPGQTDLERRFEASLTVLGRGRQAGGRLDPATRREYARSWRRAKTWVTSLGLTVMPWSSALLADYARHLLERGYAKSTVSSQLAAVKAKHRERGEPVPDGVPAWFVLRGADDTAPGGPKVNSLRPRRGVLAAAAAGMDAGTAQGSRDLCLMTLGWDLHGTVSEMVGIDVDDVWETGLGLGLEVRVAGRAGVMRVEHTHEPVDVCPVEATLAWVGMLRGFGVRSGPLFRGVDKGGNIAGVQPRAGSRAADWRLSPSGVQRIWRRAIVAGTVPRSSVFRDLRTASAVEAVRNGVPVQEVIVRGGWSLGNATIVTKLMRAAAAADDAEAVA